MSVVLILQNKPKAGILLSFLYLIIFPFMLMFLPVAFETLFNTTTGIIVLVLLLGSVVFLGLGLLMLRIFKKFENRVGSVMKLFSSKAFKLALCSLLLLFIVYAELFNGIESFDNREKFFEFKKEIGMGHILPYRLSSYDLISGGNVARYGDLPLTGYCLYFYEGELYYVPAYEDFDLPDGKYSPDVKWVRWGQKYDYRPD